MWQYAETAEFVSCAEKNGLSDKVREALKSWAPNASLTPTNRSKPVFRSEKQTFEIWVTRVPNPDANRGSSGGYRLVHFFNHQEKTIYLDRIVERSDKGGRDEHPKDQQHETEYLIELKKHLLKEIDGITS